MTKVTRRGPSNSTLVPSNAVRHLSKLLPMYGLLSNCRFNGQRWVFRRKEGRLA